MEKLEDIKGECSCMGTLMGNVMMGTIKYIKGEVSPTARLSLVVYSPVGHFPEMGGKLLHTIHAEALTAYLILASTIEWNVVKYKYK